MDAVLDAPWDASTDAVLDAPWDAVLDAPWDASTDAVLDAPWDSAMDASADAPVDAAADASPPLLCSLPPPALTLGVSTLVGCDVPGTTDGDRSVAQLANPVNVALGPDGALYVTDFDSSRVRVVTTSGTVTTLVAQPGFQRPFGIAFAPDGTLYVQTDDNEDGQHSATTGTIWRVDTSTGEATVVVADVGRPRGILVLDDGRLVLSDYVHHTVSLLDPETGEITVLAGEYDSPGWIDATGPVARFQGPYGVALLPDGRIAVADLFNNRIRAVDLDGVVTTIAGTGAPGASDDVALAATFDEPHDVAIDDAGNLYVADTGNVVVRRIDTDDNVTTVAGSGAAGWLDHDSPLSAQFHGLEGIEVSGDGSTLWAADGSRGEPLPYHRLRVVDLDAGR